MRKKMSDNHSKYTEFFYRQWEYLQFSRGRSGSVWAILCVFAHIWSFTRNHLTSNNNTCINTITSSSYIFDLLFYQLLINLYLYNSTRTFSLIPFDRIFQYFHCFFDLYKINIKKHSNEWRIIHWFFFVWFSFFKVLFFYSFVTFVNILSSFIHSIQMVGIRMRICFENEIEWKMPNEKLFFNSTYTHTYIDITQQKKKTKDGIRLANQIFLNIIVMQNMWMWIHNNRIGEFIWENVFIL